MKIILTPKQKEFQKLKRFVTKRVPNAHTYLDSQGHYFVVDAHRENVVPGSLMLPPAKSVREAWEQAKYAMWYTNMINKSNAAFSEEKLFKKLMKETGSDE